jgi:fructoselysine-6-P-deglycase FrlB-like protein
VLDRRPAGRSVAITAVPEGPVGDAAHKVIALLFADERSVVQTRFATTALTLLRAYAGDGRNAVVDAERALTMRLPVDSVTVTQLTFVGRGWTH